MSQILYIDLWGIAQMLWFLICLVFDWSFYCMPRLEHFEKKLSQFNIQGYMIGSRPKQTPLVHLLEKFSNWLPYDQHENAWLACRLVWHYECIQSNWWKKSWYSCKVAALIICEAILKSRNCLFWLELHHHINYMDIITGLTSSMIIVIIYMYTGINKTKQQPIKYSLNHKKCTT